MEVASNFCLLHAKLSKLGFDDWASINEGDVMTGNPHTFAQFLRFLYRRFPNSTATLLRTYDWFLVEADDGLLGASTIRVLSTASHETNFISAVQFQQCKYSMAKINMCHALLKLLRSLNTVAPTGSKRQQLMYGTSSTTAIHGDSAASRPSCSVPSNGVAQLRIKERRSALNSVSRT
jgi:hypothetical protein